MNLNNPELYYNIENLDREEMAENRKVTIAIKLFKKIFEDFFYHNFTLQDIKDSYNYYAVKKDYGQRYGQRHLDKLVEMGLLIYDDDSKTYSVNHNSPDVARIIEGEANNESE